VKETERQKSDNKEKWGGSPLTQVKQAENHSKDTLEEQKPIDFTISKECHSRLSKKENARWGSFFPGRRPTLKKGLFPERDRGAYFKAKKETIK